MGEGRMRLSAQEIYDRLLKLYNPKNEEEVDDYE